jgi:hypothetical protein
MRFFFNKSYLVYNSITNQLRKNKLFNDNFNGVSDLVSIDENHFSTQKRTLIYCFADDNKFGQSYKRNIIKGKIINDNLKFTKVG